MNNNNTIKLSFSALNPYIEQNQIKGVEKEVSGQGMIWWGTNNHYPAYLNDLYNNVATLQSIINTCVDYTVGDAVESSNMYISNNEAECLIYEMAKSYLIYGGFALNILRNRLGEISKVCVMDFKKIRSSKNGKTLYYAENYSSKSYSRYQWQKYPSFDPTDEKQLNSIYYFKNSKYTTYPIPIYSSAISACEMERGIDDYHINSLNNGFTGSVIINLNNGVPDEEQQEEIERNFNEKFCGKENAGRIVISYANDKDHQATIEKLETEDFSERYKSLAERSKETIFTAFRITPTLCGIPSTNLGFSAEQYEEQFALFNRTVIRPIQKKLLNELTYVLGGDYVTITPFKVDFNNTEKVEEV